MSVMSAEASGTPTRQKYDRLIAAAKDVPPVPTIVVHPCDESSLRGAVDSRGGRHHQADPRRARRPRSGTPQPSTVSNIAGFEIVDAAAQRGSRRQGASN